MWVLLLCVLAAGAQAIYLSDRDDTELADRAFSLLITNDDIGSQHKLLRIKQRKPSPSKNQRKKTKVNSQIKQDGYREFSHEFTLEPKEYRPPRGKQKAVKLSAFNSASVAQGIQFIADIVNIVSSDFWKWMNNM